MSISLTGLDPLTKQVNALGIDNWDDFTFDEIWAIREQCIENLTEKPAHNN